MTCAAPAVRSLDVSRRYGAEWQQYYAEHTDYDYADAYGDPAHGHGADSYVQLLSGEVPDSGAQSGEVITVEGTPEQTADVSCVTGTYHPSGSSCSTFHVCRRGRLTEVSCPSDMWFDPRHKDDVLCNHPEVVCAADNSVCDCAEKYPPLPPDPLIESAVTCLADQRFHFTASQVECGRYFVCFNEKVRRLECREGLQFNPETEQCDYPEIVNCQVRVWATGTTERENNMKRLNKIPDRRSGLSAGGHPFSAARRAGRCVLLLRTRLQDAAVVSVLPCVERGEQCVPASRRKRRRRRRTEAKIQFSKWILLNKLYPKTN